MAKLIDDTYKSTYSTAINDLVNKAVNREAFSYDPATDAAYQSYAKQYTRLGNEAAQNTLADVAANTGGLASSYATTAASQARASYNQALTDKIPTLMEAAYSKYQDEYNNNLNLIGTLQGLDDSAYSRYASDRDYNRSTYESDRNYNYQLGRDRVADNQWQQTYDRGVLESDRNYAYQQQRDKVSDQQWQQTYDENVRQFDKNYDLAVRELENSESAQEFQQNLQTWQTLGKTDEKTAKYFGVPVGTSTQDAAYQTAQLALEQATLDEQIRNNKENNKIDWYQAQTSRISATRSSGGGGGGGGGSQNLTAEQMKQIANNYTPTQSDTQLLTTIQNGLMHYGATDGVRKVGGVTSPTNTKAQQEVFDKYIYNNSSISDETKYWLLSKTGVI